MSLELAFNTTDTVLLVSADGRSIGGKGWGPVDTTEALAARHLKSGALLKVPKGKQKTFDGAAPGYDEALALLTEMRAAAETPVENQDEPPPAPDTQTPEDDTSEGTATPKPRRGQQ